jgi:hypothetical protein
MSAVNRIYHPLIVALSKGGASRDRAIATIRAALRAHNGSIPGTAEQIGCAPRTLMRWLAAYRDELQSYAGELRAKAGIVGPREPRSRVRSKR